MDVLEFNIITREEFFAVYNKHLPARWIRFAYKYFSKETVAKDFAPGRIIVGILLTLFGIGIAGTIMKWPRAVIGTVTISYAIILSILVFFLFAAVFANNVRLKKVMKILDVNKVQYNKLADRFFEKD